MTETPMERGGADIPDVAQLDTSDTLDDDLVADPLDHGYSPPDRARGSRAHGVTAREQAERETIEARIRQEEEDPDSAYGAPHNESGLDEEPLGGDDPDAIDPEDDWLGGEVGRRRSGRLVAPDHGLGPDDEGELYGEDVGIDGGAASAEEAAIHVVDVDDDDYDEFED